MYYVQPLAHVAGMLMAYLPAERIAFEADLFDTHEPPPAAPTPAMRSLFNQVQRMKLDVATLAPVHGPSGAVERFHEGDGQARAPQSSSVGPVALQTGHAHNSR